jgi:sugar (glycoside-pentoside-hexuronide) transporter
MERWKAEVEARTNGRVKIRTYPGGTLLGAKEIYDGVVGGTAAIGNFAMSYQPGRFPVSEAADLPHFFPSSKVASVKLAQLLHDEAPAEFSEVKVLTAFTCPPGVGATGKLVYAYATYILFTLVYTANNIPYGALMAVMTGDDRERASIGSFRMAGAFAGGMLVQGLLLYLKDCFGSYSIPIYIMSVVLAGCLLVTFWGTKERVEPPADQGSDILADLRQLVTNWPWVVLLVVGLLFNVYNAVRQGITVIYFTHYMHREVLCSAFLTAIMVASIGGALATGPLARRFGKRVLFVASLLLAGAVNSLFAICGPGDVAAVFAIGIVGEALSAVFPTLFFTMLGDAADYSEYVNGRRATGLVYSAGSFATKFGGGVAGFIIGIVLARYGYDGKDAEAIAGALPGIRLLMGLIPSAIAAGTAFLMVLYPLSDRRLSEITEELSRRRG